MRFGLYTLSSMLCLSCAVLSLILSICLNRFCVFVFQWTLLMVTPNAPSTSPHPSPSLPHAQLSHSPHLNGVRSVSRGQAPLVTRCSVRHSPFPSPLLHDDETSAFTRIYQHPSQRLRENASPMVSFTVHHQEMVDDDCTDTDTFL